MARLILELRLPEQLEGRLLHAVARDSRVGLDPPRPLRISTRRRPIGPAASLGLRGTGGHQREDDRQSDRGTEPSLHVSSFMFISAPTPARWPVRRAEP